MLVTRLFLIRSENPKENTREEGPIRSIDIPNLKRALSAYKSAEIGGNHKLMESSIVSQCAWQGDVSILVIFQIVK